jgi:hypothetical protein
MKAPHAVARGRMLEKLSDDAQLFAWLRHYGARIVVLTMIGAGSFAAWGLLRPQGAEASTIVVDTRRDLPARELSVVAETLFRTQPAAATAELRSVPDARLLFVIGYGCNIGEAGAVSRNAAGSLVQAFERSGYPGFRLLRTSARLPGSTRISTGVLSATGGAVGLWVGVASCIISFARRSPILTIERAMTIVGPTMAFVLPGRWRALGSLRPPPPMPRLQANAVLREELAHPGRLLVPGVTGERRARLERSLVLPGGKPSEGEPPIVAVHAGTPKEHLSSAPPGTQMVWIT